MLKEHQSDKRNESKDFITKSFVFLFGILIGICCCFILHLMFSNKGYCILKPKPKFSIFQLKKSDYLLDTDEKDFLLIGVLTAKKYLDTRGKAAYDTWGKHIPGKVILFSSEGSKSNFSLPVVSLNRVDDDYPPQKKSFLALKFMHDHYLEKYEWFMRVDDDIYVKPDKIETFLRSINSSKPHFIGQPGFGNKKEFGLLSLEEDENFCMGGTGMIFSRETLRRFVPYISNCLRNLYTTHEDVEIGRCVKKYANTSCTWSYQVAKLHALQNFPAKIFEPN